MKKMRLLLPVGVGLVLVAGTSLVGCGSGSDSGSTVTPISTVTFSLKAHAVTFSAVDAKTGTVISAAPVAVTLVGPGDLSDALGRATTSFTAHKGAVTAYTDATAEVTAAATADGYLPSSASVYVSRAQNVGAVKLVKLSAPPTGVTVASLATAARAQGAAAASGYRVDFNVATALAYVPGSGAVAGVSDAVLKFSSVSALTVGGSDLSLAATGTKAEVYYLAPGASAWTDKGTFTVANGSVTVPTAAAGTWAVASTIPAGTVTFGFSKSIGYDAEVTLSAGGWTRTFRSAGDSVVRLTGVPTGVSLKVTASFNGTQLYLINHVFAAGETFDLNYAVTPAGASQTFVAKCTDGNVPSDFTPGVPLLVFNNGSEVGAVIVGPNVTTVSGLGSTAHAYQVPLLDATWSFTPSSATIVIKVDCVTHIITGATGASSN